VDFPLDGGGVACGKEALANAGLLGRVAAAFASETNSSAAVSRCLAMNRSRLQFEVPQRKANCACLCGNLLVGAVREPPSFGNRARLRALLEAPLQFLPQPVRCLANRLAENTALRLIRIAYYFRGV